ncbi:methyltransferase domain-containing protein [Micromonospora sp. NPDC005686]|uniref:methyltransferase domain-containing protein n=1 Tax=unclassified Micromonospora TaxID=2617518 RepID=UPI0033B8CF37
MTVLMIYSGDTAPDAPGTRSGGVPLVPAGFDWPLCGECDGPMQFLTQVRLDDDSFDGAWSDRTVQHLADPHAAIGELVRVVRPGGRIVLADPDYDTQVLGIADQDLARRVLRFRADVLLRNGTLAHQHAGILATLGLTDVTVEPERCWFATRPPPTTFWVCAAGPPQRLSAAYSNPAELARSKTSSTMP